MNEEYRKENWPSKDDDWEKRLDNLGVYHVKVSGGVVGASAEADQRACLGACSADTVLSDSRPHRPLHPPDPAPSRWAATLFSVQVSKLIFGKILSKKF